MDSGPGQWSVITGFLAMSWVLLVLDLQCKFSLWSKFWSLPQERKQNEFPLRSELIFFS